MTGSCGRSTRLTRFPLFFPEKRGFFLDGATFFDFHVPAFFSRRVGLDANGQPQRILGGAKLTGQAGRYDVGALYVRTGEDEGALGEDFMVALVNNVQFDSVSRVVGWQSRFRWIVTPGNDLFIVYTHNWLDPADPSARFMTLDRRGAAKAVYTKRF